MKRLITLFTFALSFSMLLSSCGKGWQMDYGKPAAQFYAKDVESKASPFVGKKITVKGKVQSIDRSEAENVKIILEHQIICHTGRSDTHLKVGEVVFMSGFLDELSKTDIVLDPAMSRDPTAPFHPIE